MRIFVTVGTQVQPFERLFNMLENIDIDAHVIMQTGSSNFISKKYECNKFVNDFDEQIKKADLIICHGGIGSILGSIKQEKKVIAVARLSQYNEHVNDHQVEIVDEYSKIGYIKKAENQIELKNTIKNIDAFVPKKFESNNERFIAELEEIIDNI